MPSCFKLHLCGHPGEDVSSGLSKGAIGLLVQCVGSQWAKIAKLLPGRTANALKKHWNLTLRHFAQEPTSRSEPCGEGPCPNAGVHFAGVVWSLVRVFSFNESCCLLSVILLIGPKRVSLQ